MARFSKTSRFLPIIIIVIIIVIAVAAIVSLAQAIFFSGNSSQQSAVDESREALLSTDVGSSVSMTVRGAIVSNEEFRSYTVTISPTGRTLTTYQGYQTEPIDTVSLGNNVPAYEEFVYALDKANYSKGEEFQDEARNDTRGVCADGLLYEFTTADYRRTVERLWTSSCSGSRGSLNANVKQLSSLFLDQIPEARDRIRDIDLT